VAIRNEDTLKKKTPLLILAFSALGVVYGDIGTSPLYAFRICFSGGNSIAATPENVLGVLSLIFWALILIITVKYLLLVLRADNEGEGGILALMALVLPKRGRAHTIILVMGLFGAALLYGDGTITPAISVLSAVEGLEVAAPVFGPYVIPITLAILFGLFLFQYRGTGTVGRFFGPVMMIWFLVIAGGGIASISKHPAIFSALNPFHAFLFFKHHGLAGLFILGALFLVVTGGEALYADIGHFGRSPIRLAWFVIVLPSLLLNYFGQGALVLRDKTFATHSFFYLFPDWSHYAVVALSTMATIIASQAIISGVFSLTYQAQQLGYLPRQKIRHTSEEERGQIYISKINWMLFAATAGIVVGFRTSGNLAAAYGVAVSTTMVITTILGYFALRSLAKWSPLASLSLAGFFLIIDLSFFGANMLKILQGGWLPFLLGAFVYLLMSTWVKGREIIKKQLDDYTQPLKKFIEELDRRTVKKVPGTVIYMTSNPLSTPPAFLYNIKHNKIIHQKVIFLSVGYKNVPFVPSKKRILLQRLPKGFYRIVVRYGFMDRPDIQAVLRIVNSKKFKIDINDTTFIIGRETLIPSRTIGMSRWRDKLYVQMSHSAEDATKYFNIPPDRVFEIGAQIKF
jgi:KUP system potassium uptake protein